MFEETALKPNAHIVRMTRLVTANSGSPRWQCVLDNGEVTGVFLHNDAKINNFPLMEYAGYAPELRAMVFEDVLMWTEHPIPVFVSKNGKYWNLLYVEKRGDNSKPDTLYAPPVEIHKSIVEAWAGMVMHTTAAPVWILDFETEDLQPDAAIISVGLVSQDGLSSHHWYVLPPTFDRLITPGKNGKSAQDVTGITPELLQAQGKPFAEIYPLLFGLLNRCIWVIYNADFDAPLLTANCVRYGLNPPLALGIHCAMRRVAEYVGEWNHGKQDFKWLPLGSAAAHFAVSPVGELHNALTDADLTRRIICEILKRSIDDAKLLNAEPPPLWDTIPEMDERS